MGILSRTVLGEIMRSAVLFLAIVVLCVSGQTDPAIQEKAGPSPSPPSGVEEHDCGDWTALQPVKIGSGETKCFTTIKTGPPFAEMATGSSSSLITGLRSSVESRRIS